MSLTYRPTTRADLESCFRIVSDRGAYGPSDRETALAFWEQLLQSKAALSRVVEDRSLAAGEIPGARLLLEYLREQ